MKADIKVKVVKSFIDKTTQKVRKLNEEFSVTEERFKEIEKAGHYVEALPEKETKVSEK